MTNVQLKDTNEEKHVLAILLDDEAGALGRVVGLFSGRGYNISSLTVSKVDSEKKLSRITITTSAPEHVIKHIVNLLERVVPVHKVKDLTSQGMFIQRGLALIKVKAVGSARQEIIHLADDFDAKEVDATSTSFVFQLADIPSKINEFIEIMQPYGILEIARTGITALGRGEEHI